MAGQPTQRALLAEEARAVFIAKIGSEHLHRHGAVEIWLRAPIDNPEAATPDFLGIGKPDRLELFGGCRNVTLLRGERIILGHRLLHSSC
ncbi:hypothetical protein SAMN04490220_0225 [Rhodococcus jostii]|uniref:Uncharacterized protein n=1 Tax=Rhodococcus jostii TaxID=132919 RepID=A0A1H4ILQ7_RHOJO|nr:hypothetical protein SAMN04490220_0225 [Rhodococcus jostii]